MTKADKQLAKDMKSVRTRLHRRMGVKMCEEMHADCLDCKTRFMLIGMLNSWIDLLE